MTLTGLIQSLLGGSRSKIFAHRVAVLFHHQQNLIFSGYVASRWHELCERNGWGAVLRQVKVLLRLF